MLFIEGKHVSLNTALQLGPSSASYNRSIISNMINQSSPLYFRHQDLFRLEVVVRSHIIQSAFALSKSNATFETFYTTKGNPRYWSISQEGGLKVNDGVKPSVALKDLFDNGKKYGFECASAMEIIFLRAILVTFGSDVFDYLYQDLYIWDWRDIPNLPLTIEPVDNSGIPGDVLYFKNPDVSPMHLAFQGENVIVLPDGKFFGHGLGIGDADFIIAELNKARRPGATRSAYLMPRATRLVTSPFQSLVHGFIDIPQPAIPV